jgi:hypothetical protein
MVNKSLAASLAWLFVLFVSCDSETQSRNNSNSKKKVPVGAEAGDPSGEEGGASGGVEGEDEAEGGSSAGTGEAEGNDDSTELTYAADESLYYSTFAKSAFDAHCISCHPDNIPSLTTFESIRNNAEDIKESLINKSMPPSNTLPDQIRIKMVNWILAGNKRAPSALSFEKPFRLNTPVVGGIAEIKVALANNKADATWKLFYTTTPDVTTGGTLIGNAQPISGGGSYNWSTSTIPPGTYYLYAELKDGVESAVAKAAGSFRIGLPSVILGQDWRAGSKAFLSTADLTYAVQHTDNTKNYLVNLAVKKGGGAFQSINAANNADLTKYTLPGSYTFTDGLNYIFKATLLENGVEVHSDESLGPVGIANAIVTYASLRTDFIDSQCESCHVAPNHSGSFQTALYNTSQGALAKAAVIVERMNDPDEPMPLAGLLPIENRDRAKLWYWLGAAP